MNRRLIRVAQLLRSELSRLLSRERAMESALITITDIDVTPDLKQAFVYCSSLNQKMSDTRILELLENARMEWQRELGSRIKMKHTPRLYFRIDTGQKRGDRVTAILNSLDEEMKTKPSSN